ncbi:MAG: KH domain-containing protein [Ignavibacteriota bacterium]
MERPGQKAIVIGKKGAVLEKSGTLARVEMEKLFGARSISIYTSAYSPVGATRRPGYVGLAYNGR